MIDFNPAPPTVMHVDINSCFATIEQQANPMLRGKPVVVAAYTTGNGCILTSSVEAKKLGIKTGMTVRDARYIYPRLTVLPPDPDKYRVVNKKLTTLLSSYTPQIRVESIDEMVLDLKNTPAYAQSNLNQMIAIAKEIKQRIRNEIGEWITVSIGISTNRYLAKVASGLEKPDGLRWITRDTIEQILFGMKLEDLYGIKDGNASRLRRVRIYTPMQMFVASPDVLARGFHSIVGYHWWNKLHGWDILTNSGTPFAEGYGGSQKKSFGQSYALPVAYMPSDSRLWQIVAQLVSKMARRLRQDRSSAYSISISLSFIDHTHWHAHESTDISLFSDIDFYKRIIHLLDTAPDKGIRIVAVTSFHLKKDLYAQQLLFDEDNRKIHLTKALDAVYDRFGVGLVTSARMLAMERKVQDRIAFGKASL